MFYLSKINKTYYFRLRIPKDVQKHFYLREIRRTLGTTRYSLAKSLLHQFAAEAERIFTMIRSGALPEDALKRIVETFLDAKILLFEKQRNGEPIFSDAKKQQKIIYDNAHLDEVIESDEGLELYNEMQQYTIDKAKKALGRKKGHESPRIGKLADSFLKTKGFKLDKDSVEYKKLCDELLKAEIKADSIILEHLNGNYETDYDVDQKSRKKSRTLGELVKLYEDEKLESWSDKGRFLSTHRQILHILGNVSLSNVDRQACITFRDALKEYPLKVRQQDMNIPWKELAKTKKNRLSESTQRFILTEFCTLISYAKEHELGVSGSPASGLIGKKESVKPVKVRVPYTPDELQRMIGVLATVDRTNDPEFFWIPLLLLYTGARSNEVCMLRCEDVQVVDDIPIICFRNRKEYYQKTKNDKDRQAPIHNDLLKLGFLEYAESQKSKGKDRLFSNLTLYTDKNGRSVWNKGFGKDYGRAFKKKFLVDYSKDQLSAKDLHTFRATMISWYVQRKDLATVPNISLLQSIIGHMEAAELSYMMQFLHSAKLTLVDYGGGYGKADEQNELLQQLDYGIDLAELVVT